VIYGSGIQPQFFLLVFGFSLSLPGVMFVCETAGEFGGIIFFVGPFGR
jgi:hypothetical protein